MTELKSPLPPEPEYWDRLARRISADAAPQLATYAGGGQPWHGVLARRAPWLVGSSVAAMLLLWLALPGEVPTARIESLIAPTEIAGSLLGGPAPPSVERLMVQFPPDIEERQP